MASASGGARIGDAERQGVIDLLRHHTGAGRLTLDEFAERAGQVFAAQTRDELDAVLDDLPEGVKPPPRPTTRPMESVATPDVTSRSQTSPRRRRFIAIMSGANARGPWRAPAEMSAFAFWGGVDIDLRNAIIESPVVEIRAWAIMGGVTIIVPEGIPVEMSGLVVMGGSTNAVRRQDPIPGAPLIRVRTRGLWGGVTVANPRRRFGRRSRDRHGHEHHRHDRRSRSSVDVQDLVEDAIDKARGAIDRALTTGSVSDRIPPVPGRLRNRQPGEARRGSRSEPTPAPPPAPPAAPAPSPAPSPGAAAPAPAGETSTNGAIPTGTLTILISDIAGSTQIAERLGDQVWLDVLQAHNAIVRKRVANHGGTEVKAQGDGFLIVFPSARSAVLAAIEIQLAMADYRNENLDSPIDLRLGLHTGEVIATDGDVFGHNVVVASRIADAAGPGEIVVSGLTRDLTASASDLGFDQGEDVSLKGVSQPWRVHRVLYKG